jgi:ABC-2 type transport system permease protein
MHGLTILIIIIAAIVLRVTYKYLSRKRARSNPDALTTKKTLHQPKKPWQKQLFTVVVFSRLSTVRFFRDRLALFFGILFPLIFLFVFGGIFGKSTNSVSFSVAVINDSSSKYAQQFVDQGKSKGFLKIDNTVSNLSAAEQKMARGQLDAAIVIPSNFGQVKGVLPSGQLKVYYTANDAQSGQTLISVIQSEFQVVNQAFVHTPTPFSVTGTQLTKKSLTQFDYTFSGLLGFSIVGLGIFGPINVFPELKKQGILRRFHTTPLRVWQYFLSTMVSQAIIGLVSLGIMFIAAITIFHLKVVGNYLEIALFLVFSIVMILGIGLAIGGWAKNERQAAPLSNIVVFPMLFLSGTFFPRYAMPEVLQKITNYLPLTPVIDGARLLTTEGQHLTQIGSQLGLMAIWTLVIYVIAFRVFRWE